MAVAKTDKEMVTRSIYIDKQLYDQLQYASGQFGLSVVLSKLGEKWLKEEVEIKLKPRKREGMKNEET
jgi:hypothetical protein